MDPNKHYLADIPAYAIGALDKDEIPAVEAHLLECQSCRDELAAFRQVGNALLVAVPPKIPPPGIRNRLRKEIKGPQRFWERGFQLTIVHMALGTAAILILVVGNLLAFNQIRGLQKSQEMLTSQLQNGKLVMAMLSYPETSTYSIQGEQVAGSILVDRERNIAIILTWDLPKLSEDQTYQIWLIDPDGKRMSGGMFNADPASPLTSMPVSLPAKITQFTGLGVTVEPAGGSMQPTGERVFKIDF